MKTFVTFSFALQVKGFFLKFSLHCYLPFESTITESLWSWRVDSGFCFVGSVLNNASFTSLTETGSVLSSDSSSMGPPSLLVLLPARSLANANSSAWSLSLLLLSSSSCPFDTSIGRYGLSNAKILYFSWIMCPQVNQKLHNILKLNGYCL